MHLDIVSPDFFVVSKTCTTQGCIANRDGYDTAASSTFNGTAPATPFATSYGGAQSTGKVITEAFTAVCFLTVCPKKTSPLERQKIF